MSNGPALTNNGQSIFPPSSNGPFASPPEKSHSVDPEDLNPIDLNTDNFAATPQDPQATPQGPQTAPPDPQAAPRGRSTLAVGNRTPTAHPDIASANSGPDPNTIAANANTSANAPIFTSFPRLGDPPDLNSEPFNGPAFDRQIADHPDFDPAALTDEHGITKDGMKHLNHIIDQEMNQDLYQAVEDLRDLVFENISASYQNRGKDFRDRMIVEHAAEKQEQH